MAQQDRSLGERQRVAEDQGLPAGSVEVDPIQQGVPDVQQEVGPRGGPVGQPETEPVGGLGDAEGELPAGPVGAKPVGRR